MELSYSLSWLRQRRKILGLTYKELARQVGCAIITLKKIETGERKPSQQIAEKLAESLQIQADERLVFVAALRGLKPGASIPHTRPAAHREPFIGRQAERSQLRQMLCDPLVRVVTLLGPGGVGKTRLAQAVIDSLLEDEQAVFYAGIFFVDCSGLLSAEFILAAIAQSLGFEMDTSGRDSRSDLQQLADFISAKKLLLVLDNFEHLMEGVEQVESLVRSTRNLRLLVTSRQRLGLWEERLYPLEGLDYPTDDAAGDHSLEEYSAIELFLAHVRRVMPAFQISPHNQDSLKRIALLTEGNALALELAAAWVDTLSLEDIADEMEAGINLLRQRTASNSGRHASMQRVFEASIKHLEEAGVHTFRQLCLFQGGFTRPAAEAVAGARIPDLSMLIQKSLVRLDQRAARYQIHALLRQYGRTALEASGALASAAQAHFKYYAHFIQAAEPWLHGPDQEKWLGQIDHERDNLRLALQWAIDHPQNADALVDMVYALTWYWRMRSLIGEASRWLEKIRECTAPSPPQQAKLYWVSGHNEWMRGDFPRARGFHLEGIEILQSMVLGQTAEMAKLKVGMGMAYAEERVSDLASKEFAEALEIFEGLKDDWSVAFTLGWLALPQHDLGEKEQARQSITECVRLYRLLGDRWGLGINLNHFAEMEFADRNYDHAGALAIEALACEESTGHQHSVGQTLLLLGKIAQQQENYLEAEQYYRQSLEIFYQMGHPLYSQRARGCLDEVAEFLA
jgi:predicted ATPase/DNA-binding XRE family transcriptional regulator